MESDDFVSQRLVFLRSHLSENSGREWTQKCVAKAAGLTRNQVFRAEQGAGSNKIFNRLYMFYYSHGYNINWIISPDNSHIEMIYPADVDLEASDRLNEQEYEAYLDTLVPNPLAKISKLFR